MKQSDAADEGVESESLEDNVSFARPDPELETLVSVANTTGLSVKLTLVTNGAVVSGTLISYNRFWHDTASIFEEMDAPSERVRVATRTLARAFRENAHDDPAEDDSAPWPPRFIHLKDARIHNGHRYISVERWRGRMALVVGWSFGQPKLFQSR